MTVRRSALVFVSPVLWDISYCESLQIDFMSKISQQKISQKIYFIRDHKVMIDSDLAELYEVKTGALNRAVQRNANRFPSDFMFQLTELEADYLRCQIGIANKRRYLPYVFTE